MNQNIQLLVDSGSDLNFIKLSSLKDDVMVHEPTEHILTGITGHVLQSLGTVELTLTIKQEKRKALFQVVHSSFPVPHEGILGKPFIIGMKTVIDYQRKELMLTDISASIGTTESLNYSEQAESPKPGRDDGSSKPQDITDNQINGNIVLRPRTETLVSIPITDRKDGEIVLVPAQTIAKTIMCSNTINKVNDRKVFISMINPTEHVVTVPDQDLISIKSEEFMESKINAIRSNEETSANGSRLNKLNEEIHTEHLNKEEYDSLMTICKQFSDIFHLEGDKLSCTNAVYHEINVNPATQPINERPYRLPYKHKQEIDKQIQKLQEDDIIAPSRSPWNAPLLVVPKKPTADGTAQYRVCVDFRKLNQVSVGDAFPLPNITEILDQLGKSKYYSTLDLSQGYHQVPMHPDHQSKTAFSTDKGHFEFLRVPFGLKGAPATFQRLMNTVLTGLNGLKAFVYLDDIIIYALNITDHSKKLEEVFKRLREFNLKLNPSKCSFMRKEVNYLGHVITDKGVKPDPQKIKCVLDFPIPTNTNELKSFLGLSGYYRRFIPNYGQTSKPLTALLKKDAQFSWSDLCQEAFEKLKSMLTQEPLLQYPDFTKAFNLTCDASNFAIGWVLSQGPIGQDAPIAYASRNLNKAEQNYNTTEKELCAIVWGVKQFRPYLLGQKFTIITDHRALTWLFNIKDPGSRLTRWRLKLEEYEYEIQYKQGTSNTNADALSRIHPVVTRSKSASEVTETPGITGNLDTTNMTGNPDNQNLQNPSTTASPASSISEPYQQFLAAEHSPTANVTEVNGDIFDTSSDISLVHCVSGDLNMSRGLALRFRRKFGQVTKLRDQRKKLTEIAYIRQDERMVFYLITKEYYRQKPSYETFYKSLQNLKEACMEHKITTLACPRLGCGLDGLKWEVVRNMLRYIFRDSPIYIRVYSKDELTEENKKQIIREMHENPLGGHQGITRTFNRINSQYYWKGMRRQIKEYIQKCPTCQRNKTNNRTLKEPMVITTTANRAFEKIFLDIVGPLPRSNNGNNFILTLQDDLTKFAWAVPMENHEANTVAHHFVTQFVCLHGIPQSLMTDCGTEFLSKIFKEVCRLLKIRQTSTTPYHPESNGSLERSHRTLGEYLRNFVEKDQLNWDTKVPYAMFCHNSTIHSATKFQPYQLVYGHPLVVPTSLLNSPEPRYNYDDYNYEIKKQMQESQEIARKHLLEAKHKSKERYDKTLRSQNIVVGNKILLQDKTSKGKLAPKWLGPFEVLDVDPERKNVVINKKGRRHTIHQNLLKIFHE